MKVKNMLDLGRGAADIARELKIPNFYLDSTIRRARQLSGERLNAELNILRECEIAVKRGQLEERLALDRCILRLLSLEQVESLIEA